MFPTRSTRPAFGSNLPRSGLRFSITIALLVGTALLSCSDPTSPNSDFRVVSGANQTAEAGAALGPIVVRMNDPLTGARAGVALRATTSAGGSVNPTDATTNAAGDATFTWTLANTTGAQELAIEDVSTGGRFTVSATATRAAVASVSVLPNPAPDLTRTQTRQFTATLRDARGAPLSDRTVTWSSSNSTIASVGASTGLVTAIAVGSADIIATSEGNVGSARMNVVGSQPTQLAIVTQPAGAIHATDFTTQPVVEIRDANGQVVDGSGAPVTASLLNGNGTLAGTTTVSAVNGVARFTNLRLSGSGTFTLTFASTGLSSATSTSIVVPLSAASLRIVTQPGGAASGTSFSVPPVVEVLDQAGARLTSATTAVTAAIASGSGTIAGTTTVSAVNGVATFADLRINGTGAHTIVFASTGLTSATSSTVAVAVAPTQLGVSTQPAGAASGAAFTTQPVVQIRDAGGAVVANSSAPVTATIASGSGMLTGTVTVAATNGVATFTNLGIVGGGAHALTFTSPGLTSATSASFTVAQTATRLVFVAQPANTAPATTIAPVVVEVRDAADAVVTSFTGNVTLSLGANPGAATLSGTLTVAAVAGIATFSTLSVNNVGTGYTLAASAVGLTGATSVPFNITGADPSNSWTNAAGGNWSTAANWSKGHAPLASETVNITLAGTYTVTVDVDASFMNLTVGGASGAQTLLAVSRDLSIGGTMTIATRGIVNLRSSFVDGQGSISNSGTLSGGGSFGATINIPVTNQARVEVFGRSDFRGAFTTTPGSTFYAQGNGNGHLIFANGFTNLGTMDFDNISAGDGIQITVQSGQLVNGVGGTITGLRGNGGTTWFNGALENQGTINVASGGAVDMSIGTFTNSGVINLEIGGLTPVTQHDQIDVTGTATLGGTLNVTLINGFTPTAGQTFTLLTTGVRSGTFATVNLPPSMTIQYVGTSVRVNR